MNKLSYILIFKYYFAYYRHINPPNYYFCCIFKFGGVFWEFLAMCFDHFKLFLKYFFIQLLSLFKLFYYQSSLDCHILGWKYDRSKKQRRCDQLTFLFQPETHETHLYLVIQAQKNCKISRSLHTPPYRVYLLYSYSWLL